MRRFSVKGGPFDGGEFSQPGPYTVLDSGCVYRLDHAEKCWMFEGFNCGRCSNCGAITYGTECALCGGKVILPS